MQAFGRALIIVFVSISDECVVILRADDAKLRCEHPSWQLQFQQQYSSGVTALLNSLKPQQHPSSDHAVSEAISAAVRSCYSAAL